MTKAEIVKQIAGQTGLESKMVAGVVEALLERIRAAQIGGENVYFRGFGSFVRRERAAKKARDISRNTTVLVPARTVPAFKPSKAFVEHLKKGNDAKSGWCRIGSNDQNCTILVICVS